MKDVRKMVDDAFANGEMVFVLRSRDPMSLQILKDYYGRCCLVFGSYHPFTKDLDALMREWDMWQRENPHKLRRPSLDQPQQETETKEITAEHKTVVSQMLDEIGAEYRKAIAKFPPFCSDREGFDILDEEVQELKQEIRHGTPPQAKAEAIQVGAAALGLLIDVYNNKKRGLNGKRNT